MNFRHVFNPLKLYLRQEATKDKGNDKGLIPTKDDGPWHMLRRKGVP